MDTLKTDMRSSAGSKRGDPTGRLVLALPKKEGPPMLAREYNDANEDTGRTIVTDSMISRVEPKFRVY